MKPGSLQIGDRVTVEITRWKGIVEAFQLVSGDEGTVVGDVWPHQVFYKVKLDLVNITASLNVGILRMISPLLLLAEIAENSPPSRE